MAKKVINIHEAKTNLSRIVDDVAAGAEVVIAKAGKPIARLVPFVAMARQKKLSLLKGKISTSSLRATPSVVVDCGIVALREPVL